VPGNIDAQIPRQPADRTTFSHHQQPPGKGNPAPFLAGACRRLKGSG
jgi:hypothetical protein